MSGPQNLSLDGVVQDPDGKEGFGLGGWFVQFGGKDHSTVVYAHQAARKPVPPVRLRPAPAPRPRRRRRPGIAGVAAIFVAIALDRWRERNRR